MEHFLIPTYYVDTWTNGVLMAEKEQNTYLLRMRPIGVYIFGCMYTYVCVYVHVFVHKHIYTNIHTYAHQLEHFLIPTYYVDTWTNGVLMAEKEQNTYLLRMRPIGAYIFGCMYTYVYVYVHVFIHEHIYICAPSGTFSNLCLLRGLVDKYCSHG